MATTPKHGGTDNVLINLSFPDAAELTAKTILAKKLNDVIDSRHLTQSDAAELLGMPEPRMTAIRNYRLRGVSLMGAPTCLGHHVEIIVSPVTKEAPTINVAAQGAITQRRSTAGGSDRRTRRADRRPRCLRPTPSSADRGC